MLNVQEGQTYVCKRDALSWWTKGKEYKVQKSSDDGRLYIKADDNYNWYLTNETLLNIVFKLKEEPKFDLNKLTHEELRIYCNLVDNLSDSQYCLDEFIKAHTK